MLGKQKIKKQHEDAAQKGKVIWKLHGVTFLKKVWGPWKVSPVPPALSGPALRKSSCLLWHLTPASSKCAQLWTPSGLLGQSTSLVSLPPQFTLSRRMGPVPWPNCANETAVAPVGQNLQIVEQNCCRVRNGLIVILYWQSMSGII